MDDVSEASPLENYRCFAVESRCKGNRAYPGVAKTGDKLVLAPDPDNRYSKYHCACNLLLYQLSLHLHVLFLTIGHHSVWVMNTTTGAKIGHISGEQERIVLSTFNGALRAQGVEFVSALAMQPSETTFNGHVLLKTFKRGVTVTSHVNILESSVMAAWKHNIHTICACMEVDP